MWTALKRWKDYSESASWSKYDGYEAAICDDGCEDDIAPDGAACYTLHRYRRASFIVWHRSDGFQMATEYSHADIDQAWKSIVDAIDEERESAAQEAHPDKWRVIVPINYPYAYDEQHDSQEDAEEELFNIMRVIARQEKQGATIEYDAYQGAGGLEVWDTDSAFMVSDLCGVYWIEHIDNSDARDDYLSMCY